MFQLMKKRIKNEKGLTLIELLAVIVILGIIAAIAVPAIGNIIQNTKDRAVLSEAANILSGAKIAIADNVCSTAASGVVTCDKDDLDAFYDGTLATDDKVVYTPATSSADASYSITFGKFADIKNTGKFGGGTGATTMTDTALTGYLKN